MTIKEQAEVYRRGLLLSLFNTAEVVAWCDSIVSAEESPDIGIIEASVAGRRGVNAVANALVEVEGDCDQSKVIGSLFRTMLNLLNADANQAALVSNWLHDMAIEGQVPNEAAQSEMLDMANFAEYIYLANEGIYGYLEEATREMRNFLEKYATPTT